MEKRMRVKLYFLGVLVLGLLAIIILMYTKDCKSDEACFSKYSVECKQAKLVGVSQNNFFLYEIKGKEVQAGEKRCIVKVTLLKLEETANQNLKNALEGKGMLCHIPQYLLFQKHLDQIENLNDYCTGPLKEVLLEISLEKLYNIVVKNIGPVALEFSKILSSINAAQNGSINNFSS